MRKNYYYVGHTNKGEKILVTSKGMYPTPYDIIDLYIVSATPITFFQYWKARKLYKIESFM